MKVIWVLPVGFPPTQKRNYPLPRRDHVLKYVGPPHFLLLSAYLSAYNWAPLSMQKYCFRLQYIHAKHSNAGLGPVQKTLVINISRHVLYNVPLSFLESGGELTFALN